MNLKKLKKKELKPVPKFKNDLEEAIFWDTHSLADYFDFSKPLNMRFVLEDTKKDESVTIRFQGDLMKKLKEYAASLGLSVSSLIRMWSIEKLTTAKQ